MDCDTDPRQCLVRFRFDSDLFFSSFFSQLFLPENRAQVLISGWLRRDSAPCFGGLASGGRRKAGISFLLNPNDLIGASSNQSVLSIKPIDEEAECSFLSRTKSCVQENLTVDGDAIYCAGDFISHFFSFFFFFGSQLFFFSRTHDACGRQNLLDRWANREEEEKLLRFVCFHTCFSFFGIGGGRYANTSSAYEHEWGLDYGRLFSDGEFERVQFPLPMGTTWYPTAARLPDSRILVTGAFSA